MRLSLLLPVLGRVLPIKTHIFAQETLLFTNTVLVALKQLMIQWSEHVKADKMLIIHQVDPDGCFP